MGCLCPKKGPNGIDDRKQSNIEALAVTLIDKKDAQHQVKPAVQALLQKYHFPTL